MGSESQPAPVNQDWAKEEYKALNESARHDDVVTYTLAGVFIPVSLAAVVIAWQSPVLTGPLAIASIFLYGFNLLVIWRLRWFSIIRRERMWFLEGEYGLYHHLQIRDRSRRRGGPINTARLWLIFYYALLIVWFLTALAHRF